MRTRTVRGSACKGGRRTRQLDAGFPRPCRIIRQRLEENVAGGGGRGGARASGRLGLQRCEQDREEDTRAVGRPEHLSSWARGLLVRNL